MLFTALFGLMPQSPSTYSRRSAAEQKARTGVAENRGKYGTEALSAVLEEQSLLWKSALRRVSLAENMRKVKHKMYQKYSQNKGKPGEAPVDGPLPCLKKH